MKYLSELLWEKNARKVNEDSLTIYELQISNRPLLLAVLCDGIGGLSNGELASSFVTARIRDCVESCSRTPHLSLSQLRKRLNRELYECHDVLLKYAQSQGKPLGTTICLCLIMEHRALIMSCGDSRIYTGIHALKNQVPLHQDSHGRLTRSIGVGAIHIPYYKYMLFPKGTNILLCSDGFYRANHNLITSKDYFSRPDNESAISSALHTLYCNAVNHGEQDNCSCIFIHIK